jgi:cellulose synthase/poly-beta-1,6-N-acetylglucosamine synthase-like glycosyltransferase
MLIFLCLIFVIYLYFVFWLLTGINKAAEFSITQTVGDYHQFSIIIAAHNEESVIQDTLSDLVHQDYSRNNYQIIVVLDRCTDGTREIARKISSLHNNIELIEIKKVAEGVSPKKYALQKGIQKARYDYLILMDADCRSEPEYLKTINAYFQAGAEVLLNIPKFKPVRNFLYRYILPERLITWSIAAAGIGRKKPFLAFGTTWAYTRAIYEKAGGFEKFGDSLSGDDDLLIYQMGKLKPEMAVCTNPGGWGITRIPHNLSDYFIQRRRHHSAGKFYAAEVKLGYAIFHISNFALWILPFFYLPGIAVLFAKLIVDYQVMKRAGGLFAEDVTLLNFFIFEIGYLLHHIFIAPLGFIGKIKWR